MREHKIERNLLEKMGDEFVELTERAKEQSMLMQQAARQSHFDKNYKKQ